MDEGTPDVDGQPARRRWWHRAWAIVLVGFVPVPFGLYFLGIVGIGLALSDRTRDASTRGGVAVLLLWWMYTFGEGAPAPYASAVLLLVAAALLGQGALARRRTGSADPAWNVVGVAVAVGLAVLSVVPYGYRTARLGRDDALRLTVAARTAHPWKGIGATRYLVDKGRLRFVYTPVWYVALYEPNPTVDHTADNQPCFSRREVWQVDALSGTAKPVQYDESRVVSDPCLPIRMGTARDLKPLPT